MKLIYHEVNRENFNKPYKEAWLYFRSLDGEPYDLPALLYLESGCYDGNQDKRVTAEWRMLTPGASEASCIREAIKTLDELPFPEPKKV